MNPLQNASENNLFDIDVDVLDDWQPIIWRNDVEFPTDWKLFEDYENPQSLMSLAFRAIGRNWLRFPPILETLLLDFPKQRVYKLNIKTDRDSTHGYYDSEYPLQFQVTFKDDFDDRFDLMSIMNILDQDPNWLYQDRNVCLTFTLNTAKRMMAELAFNFGGYKFYGDDVSRRSDSAEIASRPYYRYLNDLMKDLAIMSICKSYADFKKALLIMQGVEPNPGPASVEYVNYASKNPTYYDLTLVERTIVQEDGSLEWLIKINVDCNVKVSSSVHRGLSKKAAYEECYAEIMRNIKAKDVEALHDMQDLRIEIEERRSREQELELIIAKLINVKARHEMSEMTTEGSHGEETSETLKALQTNIVTTTEESEGTPTNAIVLNQMRTTTENIGNYDNLTSQWYLIDSFVWEVASTGVLREYRLPRDILSSNVAANSPPLIPFNVNYLWRGNLEVRLETKAQMFLTGQLQISSFYELDADANGDLRKNVFTASQSNHVLVNAGGSNSAVLNIPYFNRQPFIQIKSDNYNVSEQSLLNMVNVLVQVLNPLRVGTGSSSVDVAVFVRFVNSEFTGKRDGSIGLFAPLSFEGMNVGDARHEMDILSMIGTGISVAESVIRVVKGKKSKNMDNPPIVSPTDYVIPYATQNWANGTNIAEPIRTVRLDPVGSTVHGDVLENIESLNQISQIFGLLRQIEWSESNNAGTTLFIIPCTPLAPMNEYVVSPVIPSRESRYIPPVGVVASLFNLYRGPLQYRMDFVANKFYLGGLIMGYIPGITPATIVTNEMIRNSAFTTYSLDANNLSITYETPFINAAEWYNSPYRKALSVEDSRKPGCFVINVLQRLQQPENVNSSIAVNIYMAAGSGFECANLTQPALVEPDDAYLVLDPNLILTPLQFGQRLLSFPIGEILGWGDLSPFILNIGTQYMTWSSVFPANSFMVRGTPVPIIQASDGNHAAEYWLALRQLASPGDGFNIVMYGINQSIVARNAIETVLNALPYTDADSDRTALAAIPGSPFASSNGYLFPNVSTWTIVWTQGDPPETLIVTDARHEMSERENAPNIVTSVQHYATNGWGMGSFGEDFGNVKDLLRRPIHFEDFIYTDNSSNKYPNALFKLKVTPVPPRPDRTDQFDLINRSSHTKILLSGYRYYRGSMRYRIIMPYLPGAYAWVQYDSSDKIGPTSINFPVIGRRTPIMTHSNPMDILTLSVNQILNVEIPWYNPNQMNLLQTTIEETLDTDQRISSDMGSITVGVNTNTATAIPGNYVINVFSKVGDDFCPYVFQGFPPMTFNLYLNPTAPGLFEKNKLLREGIEPNPGPYNVGQRRLIRPYLVTDARHEMLSSMVGKTVKTNVIEPIVKEVEGQVASVAADVRSQIGDVTNSIGEALQEIIAKVKKSANINLDFNINVVLTDLISQLGHCLMNPSLKTLVWSIISMLAKIGILSFNLISKAVSLFTSICSSIFGIYENVTSTTPQPDSGVTAEHNSDDGLFTENVAEFWSLIISSCATLIGLTTYRKKSGDQIAESISKDLRGFTMTSNSLTGFFKLHLEVIKRIFRSLCFWKNIQEKDPESMMVYNGTFIKTWCNEVSYLTSPGMSTKILGDTYLSDRVFLAHMIGELIAKSVISKTTNTVNNAVLMRQLNAINRLHSSCVMNGKNGNVRRETFGVWIDGAPGIGKSFIVEEMSTLLILKGQIDFEGEKTLCLNPSDKYWSRCDKQPVLWIDDAFQLQTETFLEAQLAAYFSVMSPTPLCPPMADLKDKDRLYEPYFLFTTSNEAFPNVKAVLKQQALWRRRHLLIKAVLNHEKIKEMWPEYVIDKHVAENLPTECMKNYNHLLFKVANTPKDMYTRWSEWMHWDELKVVMETAYERFLERSMHSYNHRLNKYYEAKRQVMPDYFSDLPNVPNETNLFKVAKEMAMRLDVSARSIDEVHWYDLLTLKRECGKFTKMLFNIPKHMLAMLCGNYPAFTYGVNSIVTGVMPNKHGYRNYQVHGLGWDRPDHSSLCSNFDRPPGIARTKPNPHGRRGHGWNPLSKTSRFLVKDANANLKGCMGESEIPGGADGFDLSYAVPEVKPSNIDEMVREFEIYDPNEEEDDEEPLFDMRDLIAEHQMGLNPTQELLKQIGDKIRSLNSTKDRLMAFLVFLTKFKKDREQYHELLVYLNFCIEREEKTGLFDDLDVMRIFKLMYYKISTISECAHYKFDKTCIYFENQKQFTRVVDGSALCSTTAEVCCDHCALNCTGFVDYIFGFVKCPEGVPKFSTLSFDRAMSELQIEEVESFKDKCLLRLKDWCSAVWMFIDNWKMVVAGISLVIAAWFMFWNKSECKIEHQGAAYDKNKAKRENRKITSKRKLVRNTATTKEVIGEHNMSQNVSDIIRSVSQNVVFLKLKLTLAGKECERVYRVFMIGERKCLMIRHYIEDIQFYAGEDVGAKLVLLCNGENEVPLPIECVNDYFVLDDQNEEDFDESREGTGYVLYNGLCVVELPKTVKQFKNMIKHFVTSKDELRMSSAGIIVQPAIGPGSTGNLIKMQSVTFATFDGLIVGATDTTSTVEVERCWAYKGVLGKGICGSLLLNADSGKIIGMHTAGSPQHDLGFAERLVLEEWKDVEDSFEMEVYQPTLAPVTLDDRTLEGSVFVLGKVDKIYAQQNSGKTRIKKSTIHGEFEVKTFPAPLDPYDERLPPGCSPLYDGVAIHGHPPIEFPPDVVKLACDDYENLLIAKCKPIRPVSILSMEEAILGNPLIGLESLPMDTSEGFPLSKMRPRGCVGKGWLFDIKKDDKGHVTSLNINPELEKIMRVKDAMRKKRIKPFTVFTDCLKDETRPDKKCRKKGGTRIFSMSPVDFTIQSRQVFGDFILAHNKNRMEVEHAIGVNPYSEEWTHMLRNLKRKGKKIIAGDHSNFGPRAQTLVAHGLIQVIKNWYKFYGASEEHLLLIEMMGAELLNAVHLVFDILYQVMCGIVSGSLFTANFNSMINSVYFRIAWHMITGRSFAEFYIFLWLITYGDDNIASISDEIAEEFNVKTLHEFFAKYDMVYTDVFKNVSDDMIPYCDISETSFLKSGWKEHPLKSGYYLPTLEMDSIEGQLNWISENGDAMRNTIANCENALRQVFGHGEKVYNDLARRIQLALAKVGEHFVYKTWREEYVAVEGDFYCQY